MQLDTELAAIINIINNIGKRVSYARQIGNILQLTLITHKKVKQHRCISHCKNAFFLFS